MKAIGMDAVRLPLHALGRWNAACQRDLTSLQHEIAANYDERSFGVIHVMRRKGKYLVIDGQNRVAALKLMGCNGSHSVPCIDHGEITDVEAAAIFHGVNNFVGLKAMNIFMAAFMRGEPDQVAIVEIVNGVGLQIAEGINSGAVAAVKALERVYRPRKNADPDPEALRRTLQTIIGAWGDSREALNGTIIGGIGAVYLRDKDRVNDAEMVDHLARRAGGPAKIIGDARGMVAMFGGTVTVCVSELVVVEYNHGRRAASRMLRPFRA